MTAFVSSFFENSTLKKTIASIVKEKENAINTEMNRRIEMQKKYVLAIAKNALIGTLAAGCLQWITRTSCDLINKNISRGGNNLIESEKWANLISKFTFWAVMTPAICDIGASVILENFIHP